MALWDPGTMQRQLPPAAGTNVVRGIRGAGAPVDGVTGAGVVDKGWQYVDTATGNTYVNTGTRAAPVWNGVALV